MEDTPTTKQFSIKLPKELYECITSVAKKSYSSKAQIIIQALLEHKKQNE